MADVDDSDPEVEGIQGNLEVVKLAGSEDPPYDFPVSDISPFHSALEQTDYLEMLKNLRELRFQSPPNPHGRPTSTRFQPLNHSTVSTPHFPGHLSMSTIHRLTHNHTSQPSETPSLCHPMGPGQESPHPKHLRDLLGIMFQLPLGEERVAVMADLIAVATSSEEVKKIVQGLPGLNFPVELVSSRICDILCLHDHKGDVIFSGSLHDDESKDSDIPGDLEGVSLLSTPMVRSVRPGGIKLSPVSEKVQQIHLTANSSCNSMIKQTSGTESAVRPNTRALPSHITQTEALKETSRDTESSVSVSPSTSPSILNNLPDLTTPQREAPLQLASSQTSTVLLRNPSKALDSLNCDIRVPTSTKAMPILITGLSISSASISNVKVSAQEESDHLEENTEISDGEDSDEEDLELSDAETESETENTSRGTDRSLNLKWGKRRIPTTKTLMYWTMSDSPQDLPNPIVPEADIGHIHLHRNSTADHVQVWMLEAESKWVDLSLRYGKDQEPFTQHPKYSALVLSTRGSKMAPSWVTVPYLKMKIAGNNRKYRQHK